MIYIGYCPRCKKDDAKYLLLHRPTPRKGAVCDRCKTERGNQQVKEYYWKNREKCLKAVKAWAKEHPDYKKKYNSRAYKDLKRGFLNGLPG